MKTLATLIGVLWIGLGLAFLPPDNYQLSLATDTTESVSDAQIVTTSELEKSQTAPEQKTVKKEIIEPAPESDVAPTKGLAGLLTLHQKELNEDLLTTFAETTEYDAPLNAGDILYLNEMGIASDVISAAVEAASKQYSNPAELALEPEEPSNPEVVDNTPETLDESNLGFSPETPQQGTPDYDPNQTYTEEIVTQSAGPTYDFQDNTSSVSYATVTPAPETETIVIEEPTYTEVERVEVWRDELAPHGQWLNTVEYGMCWRPHVVLSDPTWRPYYTSGRWVYTDHGWYWKSGYAWGHAAFHHGRWWRHARYGWLWYPDVVWAPSWVSFRSYDTYCGWAPLPPRAVYRRGFGFYYGSRRVQASFGFGLGSNDFIFVSLGHLTNPHFSRHRLHGPSYYHAYHHSRVVNNYNVHIDNSTVINNGVPVKEVEERGKTKVERVAIRKSKENLTQQKRDVIDRTGKVPTIYREEKEPKRRVGGNMASSSSPAKLKNSTGPGRIPRTGTKPTKNELLDGQRLGTSRIQNTSSASYNDPKRSQAPTNSKLSSVSTKKTSSVKSPRTQRSISTRSSSTPTARSSASAPSRMNNSSQTPSKAVLGTKGITISGNQNKPTSTSRKSVSSRSVSQPKKDTSRSSNSRVTQPTTTKISPNRIWSQPSNSRNSSNFSNRNSQWNSGNFTPSPTSRSTQPTYRSPSNNGPTIIRNVQSAPSSSTVRRSPSPTRIIPNSRTSSSRTPTFRSSPRTPTRTVPSNNIRSTPSYRNSSSAGSRSSSPRSISGSSISSRPSVTRSAPRAISGSSTSSRSSSSTTRSAPRVISGSSTSSSRTPSKP